MDRNVIDNKICEKCGKKAVDEKKGGLVFCYVVEEDTGNHYICQECVLKDLKETAEKAQHMVSEVENEKSNCNMR